MNAPILSSASKVISILAFKNADKAWENLLQGSILVRMLNTFIALSNRVIDGSTLAKGFQFLSTLLAFVLLATLGLPQFAGEKSGLALLAILGILMYLLSVIAKREIVYRSSIIDLLVLSLLYINVLSTFASHYFEPSLHGLAKVLVYVGSYFWFNAIFGQSRKKSIVAILILLVSGLVVALYGIHQYQIGVEPLATWEDPSIEIKGTRIYSTLGNPNLLAGYLMPLIPLALSLGLMTMFQKRYIACAGAYFASGVFIITMILTGSRGGYVGLFSSLALLVFIVSLFIFKSKPQFRKSIIIVLCLLFTLLILTVHFVPSFEQRILSIFAGREHTSNSFRLNVWMASWRMFLDNWWIGIGPGNKTFVLAYGLYMCTGFDALGTYCVPLEIGVETGFLGLIIFFGLLAILLSRAHLTFWYAQKDFDRWISLGCAVGIFGMMAHGMVDTVFFRPQIQFIFWFMVSLIASSYRNNAAIGKYE